MSDHHGQHHHHGHHGHNDDHCHNPVPCFIKGSKVITNKGLKEVSKVRVDDLILTRDNGFKPVAWVGSNTGYSYIKLPTTKVSPNHRMLVSDMGEALIVAKKLNEGKLIHKPVTLVHFMLEQHEIVNVDETWSESFRPGSWILSVMSELQSKAILSLFPEFAKGEFHSLARPEIKHFN